ncbi:MAG: type II toxin-antitoxin system RelE/ParE family toxin [Clostridia bacterium]|nr:type II toxin-antitoxin system RelE/ParE family toxin [Clostridia bacterium]
MKKSFEDILGVNSIYNSEEQMVNELNEKLSNQSQEQEDQKDQNEGIKPQEEKESGNNNLQEEEGNENKNKGSALAESVRRHCKTIMDFKDFWTLLQSHHGHIESLQGELKGCYSIRLSPNHRLIVKPKSRSLSAENLKKCDTVIIIGVVDYHGRGSKINWFIS